MSEPKALTAAELVMCRERLDRMLRNSETRNETLLAQEGHRLLGHIAALDAEIAALQVTLMFKDDTIRVLNESLSRKDAEIEERRMVMKDERMIMKDLNNEIAQKDVEIAALQALVASDERDALITSLTEAYAAQCKKLRRCRRN